MKDTSATHTALNELSDGELIRRTQNGDTQAFNPLIRKYQRRIYNLIYQRVRDREAAEDVCQEVFLKAWQALPNFKGESAFYSWLYRIAVNCSINALRKRNREIVLAFEELPQGMDDVLQTPQQKYHFKYRRCTHRLVKSLKREELKQIISEAASQLPRGQYRVFQLRYQEELSIKEIASHLNRSEGTIKAHLYHAHRKLRTLLRPYLQNMRLEWLSAT